MIKRLLRFSWTVILISGLNGCCNRISQQKLPRMPNHVQGWKEFNIGGTYYLGELALRLGEETNNGNIAVKVTGIIPPDPCAESNSWSGSPRVTLQLYLVSDPQRKCEVTARNSSKSIECEFPFEASIINVISINSEEKWVYFDLRK